MNKARDRNKLTPAGVVMLGLFALHFAMCCATRLGLELTRAEDIAGLVCILAPMTVAWVIAQVELITQTVQRGGNGPSRR
jgi:hypothetical protein